MVIDKFDGEYEFLSNFYNSPIEYQITEYHAVMAPTVEHAFQAVKALNIEDCLLPSKSVILIIVSHITAL